MNMARFEKTFCSSCGGEFGPGDHGFSHCRDHGEPADDGATIIRRGGPTENEPNRPYCKDDQTCCDFVCGN